MNDKAMTVEAARRVMWLRNNYRYHRPMGELLDEGYLNHTRLTWAAERAYNADIRHAAAVLLASSAQRQPRSATRATDTNTIPALKSPVPIEKARATLWPFPPFKGQPMGTLSDARSISLKDLGFAIENAWDERVRQAAIVIAGLRLNQAIEEPSSPTGPLRVISGGESYSREKLLSWTGIRGVFSGVILTLWVFLVIWTIRIWTRELQTGNWRRFLTPTGILTTLLTLVLGAGIIHLAGRLLIDKPLDRIERKIENHRLGWAGEERVAESMRQVLNGNWMLFRNLSLPSRNKADIDAILVGPPGVWALEIKNFTGQYRNFGEHWEYLDAKRPIPLKKSPSRQAQNNAARLSAFLKADGIKQWVNPAVVWANAESTLTLEQPMVPVWTLERLPDELGNLWQGRRMDPTAQRHIVEKLTSLCELKKGGKLK